MLRCYATVWGYQPTIVSSPSCLSVSAGMLQPGSKCHYPSHQQSSLSHGPGRTQDHTPSFQQKIESQTVSSSGMHSMMAMYTILIRTHASSGHHQALQKAMVRFGSDSTVHLAVRSSLWLDHLQLLFQHLQATLQLNLNDKGQIPCINMWLDLLKGALNQTR